MPDRSHCPGLFGNVGALSRMFHVAFKGTADKIHVRSPTRKRQRQNNSSEENTEGQLNNVPANLQMIEHHRRGEDEHPLHPK